MNQSHFRPPWWLKNRHLQSCLSNFIRPLAKNPLVWEELTLPDDDFLDLAWVGERDKPLVIFLHGLEGSVYSHYIQSLLDPLVAAGFQGVTMHYRSCSGRLNRQPYCYHASFCEDICFLVDKLAKRLPGQKFFLIGYSLGGNILLKYLAQNPKAPIEAAIAVCTPFELMKCAYYTSSIYQRRLLQTMRYKAIAKIKAGMDIPATIEEIGQIKGLLRFDELVTAPLNGFRSVSDYYHRSSSRFILSEIQHEVLLIQSEDDPFIPLDCVPKQKELPKQMRLELTRQGGHVGFIQGGFPWTPNYWLNRRILDFLNSVNRQS